MPLGEQREADAVGLGILGLDPLSNHLALGVDDLGRAGELELQSHPLAGVPYTARARDISPGGVRLARLLEPEHAGKRVGLQFQLPGSTEVIYAEGVVVREWIESENAQADGVRFTLLTERHRQLIRRFVEDAADAAEAEE